MRRLLQATGWVIGWLTLAAGCAEKWQPPLESVRDVQPAAACDVAAYLPGVVDSRRTYLRRGLRLTDERPELYAREPAWGHQRDGALAGQPITGLTDYLAGPGQAEPARYFTWPTFERGRGLGFFLEFDPPLVYWPPEVRSDHGTEFRCGLRVFDRWGHRIRTGTLERTVRLEGYEDMTADQVHYAACLRLAAQTAIRVRWGPRIDVTEYIWLARGLGEVKRVERIQALAFPFYFDEAFVYELLIGEDRTEPTDASGESRLTASGGTSPPTPTTTGGASLQTPTTAVGALPSSRDATQEGGRPAWPPTWARMAIFLDRFVPRLRVGGLLVEYAAE